MATDYARRVRTARRHAGLTQQQLAKTAGISQSTLSHLENDAHGSAYTAQIATACGVDPTWLSSGDGTMINEGLPAMESAPRAISLVGNPDYPAIKRVRFKLSAGASGFAVEYMDDEAEPIVFRRQWFESRGYIPAKLFATRVCNGSMEPGLYHGDTVIVNTADIEPRERAVFALNYEGELVIKRLLRDAGQWWLCSDNPDKRLYPRKACSEGVFILGRIVHKMSEHI